MAIKMNKKSNLINQFILLIKVLWKVAKLLDKAWFFSRLLIKKMEITKIDLQKIKKA